MPWFEVDGESVYDLLRMPVFHLIVFLDGKTAVPPLPDDLITRWQGMIDSTVIPITPDISETFGASGAFYVILRPDNYIGTISDDLSPDKVAAYLDQYNQAK